jgi:PAS domain S-box-containing protein
MRLPIRRSRFVLPILITVLGSVSNLFAQSPSTITEIEIAAEPDYPPYSFIDDEGEPQGFSVDLFRNVAEIMDVDLRIKPGLWNDIREDLAAGRIDALPLVGRTPEREEYFDFTVPYLTLLGGIVVAEDDTTIQGLEDLRGRRIAVMAGDNAEEFLRRNGFDEELTTVPVFSEAIKMVAAGESDAVLMQRLVALHLIDDQQISGVRVLQKPVREFRQDFCFAVTEGDKDTLALLNDGLAVAIANGTVRQLQTKWFTRSMLSSRTIIVGGDEDYPPFEFIDDDGSPAGYNVDIVRGIAEELDLEIEVRLGEWSEIVAMLERGDIDATLGMAYSIDRDRRFDFSPVHTISRYVAVGPDTATPDVPESIDELRTPRIAIQEGAVIHGFLVENGITDNVRLTETEEDALRLVEEGEVDYAVVNRLVAYYLVSENGWEDLTVGAHDIVSRDYGFAVREGDDELLSLFNEGLAIIEETGMHREIYNRWLGIHDPRTVSMREILRYSVVVFVPLIVILLATFFWNRSLRSEVLVRTRELRESERKYRLLSENTIDVIWLVSPELRIRYINPALRYLTGDRPEEWIGDRLRDHLEPREFRRIVSAAFELLSHPGREDVFTTETRFGRNTGGTVEVEIVGKPLYAADGTIEGFQGVARDISERKRYESTLKDNIQRKQSLATIATAYLNRIGGNELIKAMIDQLGSHFDHLEVLSLTVGEDGVLREECRHDDSQDSVGPFVETDISGLPDLLEALARHDPVAVSNITEDPLTRDAAKALLSYGIAALALVPVNVDERPYRLLAFAAGRPVDWTEHELLSLEENANLLHLILDNERYQRMMEDARRSLEMSLVEKQTLLQEIHHRVKNNLNVVISLLRLQESSIDSIEKARQAFEQSRQRIYSMALVHESLYRSESLSEIDVGDYLRDLTETLIKGVNGNKSIDLAFELDPVHMNIGDAVPCGIIVNEVITNALKHAFVDHEQPAIGVTLRNQDRFVELSVSDNGIGIPEGLTESERSSLGLTLVHLLTDQIDGELEVESIGGTRVTVRIPKK